MKTRLYNKKDKPEIDRLLEDSGGLKYSEDSILLVAEDENGNARGIIGVRFVPMIEPLAANHPKAAVMLFAAAETMLKKMNSKIVRCFCDDKNSELFGKVGFVEVFEDKITMEKLLTDKEK